MIKIEPTVISLFAGGGGSSLGYKMAGFKELLAIDFDKNSCDTLKLNFPDLEVWQKDIKEVSGQEILDFLKIQKGELDVLDGSPPCQGFSTAGKRQVNDERNDLFKDYIRILKELEPKMFVMENVSGQVKGSMKGRFIEIISELKSLNYVVKVKLLNAANYGVPQSRQRLFYIGIRKDLNKGFEWPLISEKFISVEEALKNIIPKEIIKPHKGQIEAIIKCKPGENLSKYHPKGYWFNYARLPKDMPSFTISKNSSDKVYHFNEDRVIAINECLILCSFPEDYKLMGNFKEQWARLGNAVMPLQMKVIAEQIKKVLTN